MGWENNPATFNDSLHKYTFDYTVLYSNTSVAFRLCTIFSSFHHFTFRTLFSNPAYLPTGTHALLNKDKVSTTTQFSAAATYPVASSHCWTFKTTQRCLVGGFVTGPGIFDCSLTARVRLWLTFMPLLEKEVRVGFSNVNLVSTAQTQQYKT